MSLLIYLFIYLFVFRSSVTIDSYLECLEVHFLIAVQGIYEKYEPFSCLSAKNALIFYLFFFRRSQVSVLHRLSKLIHVLAFCLGTRRCTSIISITHQTPKVPCFSLKACARCSVLFFHVNQFAKSYIRQFSYQLHIIHLLWSVIVLYIADLHILCSWLVETIEWRVSLGLRVRVQVLYRNSIKVRCL